MSSGEENEYWRIDVDFACWYDEAESLVVMALKFDADSYRANAAAS